MNLPDPEPTPYVSGLLQWHTVTLLLTPLALSPRVHLLRDWGVRHLYSFAGGWQHGELVERLELSCLQAHEELLLYTLDLIAYALRSTDSL